MLKTQAKNQRENVARANRAGERLKWIKEWRKVSSSTTTNRRENQISKKETKKIKINKKCVARIMCWNPSIYYLLHDRAQHSTQCERQKRYLEQRASKPASRQDKHTYSAMERNHIECLMRQNTQTDAYAMWEPPVQNAPTEFCTANYTKLCEAKKNQQTNIINNHDKCFRRISKRDLRRSPHCLCGQIFQCERFGVSFVQLMYYFHEKNSCWTFWFDLLTFGLQMRFIIVRAANNKMLWQRPTRRMEFIWSTDKHMNTEQISK